MSVSTGSTVKLCGWICATRYEALSQEVRDETLTLLYDQVGAMIASSTLPSCQPMVAMVRKLAAPGNCSIVGHPLRTTLPLAVLANGTIGHGDECDAAGQQGTGHYAATIVPAALSVGQYMAASGKEVCRAIALGSEISARILSTVGRGPRDVYAPSIGSTIGVAVTAGVLLGLTEGQMGHAVGLAASAASGLGCAHDEEMHQTKSVNHGRAAEAGVVAALLAREGCHGPNDVLTAHHGYFDAYLGRREAGHDALRGLGENYLMRQIAYKRFPVGGPNQATLYAFLQLIRKHKLEADNIDHIEVLLSRNAYNTVTSNRHPSVHMETLLCIAAVHREITFSNVNDPRYCADPRIEAFRERARISLVPRPGEATMGQRLETIVTVGTRDGQTLRRELRYPLMTQAEIRQKFHDLAGLRLTPERVSELEHKLKTIELEPNVTGLVTELELRS